eukprot:6459830-Amphidinium_carterae.1
MPVRLSFQLRPRLMNKVWVKRFLGHSYHALLVDSAPPLGPHQGGRRTVMRQYLQAYPRRQARHSANHPAETQAYPSVSCWDSSSNV